MKITFLARLLKWTNIPVLILLLLLSCDNEVLNETDIQRQILQDEDFIDMMSEVFTVKFEDSKNAITSVNKEEYLTRFNSYYDILNKRYNDFDVNVQEALADKRTLAYSIYAEKLYNKILSTFSKTSSKSAVVYDGPSVCGQPNCGGADTEAREYRKQITTACVTSAYYSETYCLTHNMGQCIEMRQSTVNFCCDTYCSTVSPE